MKNLLFLLLLFCAILKLNAQYTDATADPVSIAILPFADSSPNKEYHYLSEGIAEDIIEKLGALAELNVIYLTSTFSLKDKQILPDSIAKILNVQYVVYGNVKVDDGIQLETFLYDSISGFYVLNETYLGKLNDILEIENLVIHDILNKLKIGSGRVENSESIQYNPEAHLYLMQGRPYSRSFKKEDIEKAEPLLKKAVEINPGYAEAYVSLASLYRKKALQGWGSNDYNAQLALENLNKAMALDANIARAHYIEGWMDFETWDLPAAEEKVKLALAINPSYAPAHALLALIQSMLGKIEDAKLTAEKTRYLDPIFLGRKTFLANVYIYTQQYELAKEAYEAALEVDPDSSTNYGNMAFIYTLMERHEKALYFGEKAYLLDPENEWTITACAYAYGRAGSLDKARKLLAEADMKPAFDPYLKAIVYAGLKEKVKVFELLNEAMQEKNELIFGLAVDPVFEQYRGEEIMRQILNKLNLLTAGK